MRKRNLLLCIAFIFILTLMISANAYAANNSNYLCFTAVEDETTISMEKHDDTRDEIDTPTVYLEYSMDKEKWETFKIRVEGEASPTELKLNEGESVYFRAGKEGNGKGLADGNEKNVWDNYNGFTIKGKVALSGNIMSLLDANNFERISEVPDFAFTNLNSNSKESIVSIDGLRLPAKTLGKYCYASMFSNCTGLIKVPTDLLPAEELADYCYWGMFGGCTNLINVPKLTATQLAEGCYKGMFSNCEKLEAVPSDLLPATTLAKNCYDSMFHVCTSLKKAPRLVAKQLAESCYENMFCACQSLEKAPELPATKLAPYCYKWMFSDCDKLTKSPVLPASELCEGCYAYMFFGCGNLSEITAYFTDWSLDKFEANPTESWLKNIETTGIIHCVEELDTNVAIGDSTFPGSWTIKSDAPELIPEIDFPWWIIPIIWGGTSSGSSSSSEPTTPVTPIIPNVSYDECTRKSDCPMYVYYDLDTTKWYHDGIHFCLDEGLMNGVGSYTFDPDGTTTRPMMVTILSRMDGCDTKDGATWDEVGKTWAKKYGISDGIPEEGNITREEFATMLYRYAQKEGKGFVGSWMFLLDFKDADKVSSWADEAVHWCVMKGILQGRTGLYEGMLDPQATLTRAEASAMIQRFCEVK